MAFVVTCPHCSARMKTPGLVAAGTLVACAKCSKNFTLKADSPELLDNDPVPSKPRKKTKIDEDFIDDVDFVDDDEPIKPKRKKPRDEDDEEDEQPRSKKKRVADDEDFDDEDERPKRRKRRDDDEDELPTTRTKSRKKKKSPLVLILAISVPLLFVLCGGAGYGIYSLFFGGGASNDLLVWAPTNSDSISGIKYSKISSYPSLKSGADVRISRLKTMGLREDDIDEIMIAKVGATEIQVVRTKNAIDEGLMVKSSFAAELKTPGKRSYKGMFGCFHVPSAKILVLCPNENELTELLTKESKVTVAAELKALLDKTSGDIWQAKSSKSTAIFRGFKNGTLKGEYGGARVSESQVKLVQNWVFSDENEAKIGEAIIKTNAELMKAGTMPGRKLESFDVSRNGTTVTFTAQGPLENNMSSIFGGL